MSGLAGLTRCELAQREVLPTVSEGWPASPMLERRSARLVSVSDSDLAAGRGGLR